MAYAKLDGSTITDWDSFHSQCAAELEFPDFYGRNMNAWIDCLTYIREGDMMSRFILGPDDPLVIEITNALAMIERVPDIFQALIGCTAHVNQRHQEMGQIPALQLLFV